MSMGDKDISSIKCVNIGDTGVGKTCVLISFTENEFPEEHVPTAFDNYTSIVEYNDRPITVGLWDTSGQDNDTMRPLSYNDTKIFVIYFSLVDRNSYERVEKKWVPEIIDSGHADVPYIIVGNKVDLRNDPDALNAMGIQDKPVTKEEGLSMAKKVGAIAYLECSAKTQEGLGEVFTTAVTAVLEPQKLMPESELKELQKKKRAKGCKSQ